jgi:hypothetical protein
MRASIPAQVVEGYEILFDCNLLKIVFMINDLGNILHIFEHLCLMRKCLIVGSFLVILSLLHLLNYLLAFHNYNKYVELCLSTDISQHKGMF